MSQTEIHQFLDELTWDQVGVLAEEESLIRKHITNCADCRVRADKVNDGKLANLGAAKRRLILAGAERLAAFFLAERKRSN